MEKINYTQHSKTEQLNYVITKLQEEADEIMRSRWDQEKYLDLKKQIKEAKETKQYYDGYK